MLTVLLEIWRHLFQFMGVEAGPGARTVGLFGAIIIPFTPLITRTERQSSQLVWHSFRFIKWIRSTASFYSSRRGTRLLESNWFLTQWWIEDGVDGVDGADLMVCISLHCRDYLYIYTDILEIAWTSKHWEPLFEPPAKALVQIIHWIDFT
jgi:hypothetical protein